MVDRYYNEKNELAVLVSVGYGAGWSTWNSGEGEDKFALALDSRIVKKVMENTSPEEMETYLESIGYTAQRL